METMCARSSRCYTATQVAAPNVAKCASECTVLLTTLPDTDERYLSTFLFDDVSESSDDVE